MTRGVPVTLTVYSPASVIFVSAVMSETVYCSPLDAVNVPPATPPMVQPVTVFSVPSYRNSSLLAVSVTVYFGFRFVTVRLP